MAAVGIIVTVICQILKKSDRDDIATLVSIVGLIIVLTVVVGMVGDLFGEIKSIFDLSKTPAARCLSLGGRAIKHGGGISRLNGGEIWNCFA